MGCRCTTHMSDVKLGFCHRCDDPLTKEGDRGIYCSFECLDDFEHDSQHDHEDDRS